MKLLRRISARLLKLTKGKAKNSGLRETETNLALSVEGQSYAGALPAMAAGTAGHLALIDIFFEILVEKTPQVFCDIGANQGEAGRRGLAVRPQMKVFGFEANPNIHKMYADVNISAGVNWVNRAISDRSGELDLFIPRVLERAFSNGKLSKKVVIEAKDTGKGSILRRDENAEYDVVKVPTVTLDAYLQDHAPQGQVALWIDVEGAASAVLEGASDTLARTDFLVVEVEGFAFWQDQALLTRVIDMLRQKGFIPVLRDREYEDAQFNIIFLRDDKDFPVIAERIGQATQAVVAKKIGSKATPGVRETPLLIPCFNNPTFCRMMLKQAQAVGFEDITLVDNASDMPMMLEFLAGAKSDGVKIELLSENVGPRASIYTKERLARLPRYFCVTDPDLTFNPSLPTDFLEIMAETMAKWQMGKVGFALDISNRSAMKTEKFEIEKGRHYQIWEWEQQFWTTRLDFTPGGDAVYEAVVDTTFALYDTDRFDGKRLLKALRIGGRFTATHVPWLMSKALPTAEEIYYRDTQKHSYYLS